MRKHLSGISHARNHLFVAHSHLSVIVIYNLTLQLYKKNHTNTARMPRQQTAISLTPSRMLRRVSVSSDIWLHFCLSADGGAPTPTTDEDDDKSPDTFSKTPHPGEQRSLEGLRASFRESKQPLCMQHFC